MDPVWLGPYTINRSLGKGLYELKNDTTGEILKKKANIVRLKLYISRDPAKRKNSDDNSPKVPKRRKTENGESSQDSGWISINGFKLTVQDRENLLAGNIATGCEINKLMYHKAIILIPFQVNGSVTCMFMQLNC